MKYFEQKSSSLNSGFFEFLFWYRFVALALVVLYFLLNIKDVPAWTLILGYSYNIILLSFRPRVRNCVKKYPIFMLFDVAVSFALINYSGGYKSPFHLYTFAPVISGSYLLGYSGAIALALLQSCAFYLAFTQNGYLTSQILLSGEQIFSDMLAYFLVGIPVAYIADLVVLLNKAKDEKKVAEEGFEEILNKLKKMQHLKDLSKRELQVLCQVLEGKTLDQVASSLEISRDTAKTYLSRAYKKIGVSSKHEVLSKAFEMEQVND